MQCPKCSSSNIHRTSPEQCVCRDCLNVFESQVTENELPKKTPVKAIKKKNKIPKLKRNDMIALLVVGFFVVIPTGFWWFNRDPYICSKKERKIVSEQIDPLIQQLQDINDLASSTSRMALAIPLSQMQEVQRTVQALEIPECAEPVKQDFLTSIKSLLSAYLSFSASENDFLVQIKFSTFEENLANFGTTYQNMKDGVSNYSVELDMTEEQLAQESGARFTLGALNRGQQAYYLEKEDFSASIVDLSLGIEDETDDYQYRLSSKPEVSMVVHTATPKNKEIRAMIGAVAVNTTDNTTEAIICIPEKITDKIPDPPTLNAGKLECASGSAELR